MTIRVIHINKAPEGWETNPDYVYIGRGRGGAPTPYGNPIRFGHPCCVCGKRHTEASRAELLQCYRIWLGGDFQRDWTVWDQRLRFLKGKILVCFCDPKACHGHVLAQAAELLP